MIVTRSNTRSCPRGAASNPPGGLLRSGKMRLRSDDGAESGSNKSLEKEEKNRKIQKIHDRRLNEIKSKLNEIGNAIKDLDSIKCATEDALLTWLRGPVAMAIQRLLIGHSKKICRRVSERCHLRQLRRLDHMHKEIKRIGKQKTKEFETRKIESKKIVKNGRRLFRPLRSRKHDACHICLVDYEPGDQVVKLPVCGHELHESCVVPWIQGKETCPVCRTKIMGEGNTNNNSDQEIQQIQRI